MFNKSRMIGMLLAVVGLFGLVSMLLVAGRDVRAARGSSSVWAPAGRVLTDTLVIRPMSDVYEDGPPIITNIGDNAAQLQFVSSIPLACAVVYGPTEDFGQLTLDPDMNGGAIIDHNPWLSDLQPDTEYFYRVQGSSADGTFYVDVTGTFRTLPEQVGTETNLASLAAGASILDVSSNFGGGGNDGTWGANKAIDESPATEWASQGDGDNAFIEVALFTSGLPQAVEVWSREMADLSSRIIDFELVTDTNETFGPFTLPDAEQAYRFNINPAGPISSIRLNVLSSTGGNTGLVEFAVLEPAEPAGYVPIIINE